MLVIIFSLFLQSSYHRYGDCIQSSTKECAVVVSGAERCAKMLDEEWAYCDNRINECRTFCEELLNEKEEDCNDRIAEYRLMIDSLI